MTAKIPDMSGVNRMRYLIIGTLVLICIGSMYAWSYYKVAISAEFPIWNEKQLSITFTLMMICFALGGLAGGRLAKLVSAKTMIIVSGILIFLACQSISLLPVVSSNLCLPILYICYGVLTGFGGGIGYNAVLSSVNSWFPDKGGISSGVLLTGYGFGSLIIGKFAEVLVGDFNLYVALRIIGIICGIVIVIGGIFLKRNTAMDMQVKQAAQGTVADKQNEGYELTTGQMLRRPTFWLYLLWNFCMATTGMLVINNASSIAIYYGAAATIGLLVSLFNSGLRLVIGTSMDKLGWKITLFLNNIVIILCGIFMTIGGKVDVFGLILIGMLLAGGCYGGGITIQAALIRKFYGSRHYASNLATCNLVAIPSAIIGPMLSAALVDAGGGAYGTTFIMVMVMGLVSLVINFFIRKP